MKQILITALTEKGISKLQEHLKTTPARYRIVMRLNGIKQELLNNNLLITMDNKHIDALQLYFPEKLEAFLEEEIIKLSNSVAKMGIIEGIDYKIGVL